MEKGSDVMISCPNMGGVMSSQKTGNGTKTSKLFYFLMRNCHKT